MLQKKICMLGAFGVGKTSLVRRFVDTIFSDSYLTTVGVKLDKKTVTVRGETVNLICGISPAKTMHCGPDDLPARFGRLSAGGRWHARKYARRRPVHCHARRGGVGKCLSLLLVNKCDLRSEWVIPENRLDELTALGWTVRPTSAKTGESVEAVFQEIADRVVG
jgi:GTPase SAR1 family protein